MNPRDTELFQVLQRLLRSCRNGEAVYGAASAEAVDDDLKFLFSSYSLQRGKLARELLEVAGNVGWAPLEGNCDPNGDRSAGNGVDEEAAPRPSRVILGECVAMEEAALKEYRVAFETDALPVFIRLLLDRQSADIAASRDRIRALYDLAQPA